MKAREIALENKSDPGGWSLGFLTPIPMSMAVLDCLPGPIHNHFLPGQKRLLNGTALLYKSTDQEEILILLKRLMNIVLRATLSAGFKIIPQ